MNPAVIDVPPSCRVDEQQRIDGGGAALADEHRVEFHFDDVAAVSDRRVGEPDHQLGERIDVGGRSAAETGEQGSAAQLRRARPSRRRR